MGYKTGIKVDPTILARERELLSQGFGYTQIASTTGVKPKTIRERNRLIYKIDIWQAFRARIETEGIPSRLNISDGFGHWFAGFFDGEGCITGYFRIRGKSEYATQRSDLRFPVRIALRDDDADTIRFIKNNLKVGFISHVKGRAKPFANPQIAWHCEDIKDLAEVIIPLFDKYPLHTKKAKQYVIWRKLVIERYILTMAGHSNRRGYSKKERRMFTDGIQAISNICVYRTIT